MWRLPSSRKPQAASLRSNPFERRSGCGFPRFARPDRWLNFFLCCMSLILNAVARLGSHLARLQAPPDISHSLVATGNVTLRDGDNFPELLAQVAESQVGVREKGGNNLGPEVVEYQQATWLTPGAWAWCAAFVCWCVYQAIKIHGGVRWKRPQTAGAYDFENWAKGGYDKTVCGYWRVMDAQTTPPRRGDIVTFSWSHIGIVVRFDGNMTSTVEGNTGATKSGTSDNPSGDGVFLKQHRRHELRKIIRYTA